MFTRIFVPLDGSKRAEAALPVAARLARASQGHVILAQALPYPMQWVGTAPLVITQELLDDLAASARTYLTTQTHTSDLEGIPCEIGVAFGDITATLLQIAGAQQADVVVMTTHGRTGLTRWALGSVAQQMVSQAALPVLVLPDRAIIQGDLLAPLSPLRVVAPLDGSPVAERALEPAIALIQAVRESSPAQTAQSTAAPDTASASAARLQLVMVLPPAQDDPLPATERVMLEQGARIYLEETSQRLEKAHPGLKATWRVDVDPDTAGAILRAASADTPGASTPADADAPHGPYEQGEHTVIVMATHGRTGLARWALGSVTDRVVRASQRPVLVVRPQQQ